MKTPSPHSDWARLAAAARQTVDTRDTAAPYGFATRVAALAASQERIVISLFERFSFRALGIAALLALVSVAANYSAVSTVFRSDDAGGSSADAALLQDDPVSEIVDVAS